MNKNDKKNINDNKNKSSQSQSASFFKEMGEFIRPYAGKFALSVAISLAGVICSMLTYLNAGKLAGLIFDGQRQSSALLPVAAAIICFKILNAILLNISTWVSHSATFNVLTDIRKALVDKMLRLPLGYFEQNGSGRLKTLVVDRVESVEKTLAHILPEVSANAAAPIIMIIWAFFIDWRVALCMIIWFILGLCLSSGMMKDYEARFESYNIAEKNMNQAIVDYVGGIEVIKNFNRGDSSYEKFASAIKGHTENALGWQKDTQVFMTMTLAVTPFSVFPVLISGLIFVNGGSLEMSKLFLLILISLGIYGPLSKVINYTDSIASMGAVAKEIREVLDAPELERNPEGPKAESAEISFKNVSFAYGDENALEDISFDIKPGSIFALVGESGSGKSTIGKLLAGFWDKGSGEILIGGRDIAEYSFEELNRLIAYVDQDTWLFSGSIMDNIRIGNPDASGEEVIAAAKAAGCHEFISKLPQGYDTDAGSGGNRLSGGERQRIAIVRAMLKNAPVMILDEATASSDPDNESAIQEALSVSAKGKTLLVIAHRLKTVVDADCIAYVKGGKIIAMGTHNELMAGCPDYKATWDAMADEEVLWS